MTTKQVLVPIAHGSEEIETTCITDTLTRFGAKVTTASVNPNGELLCTMSRGIQVQADQVIEDAATRDWDLIVLPGGVAGAEALRDCAPLIELLQKQKSANKLFGAICAAPAIALAAHGLIEEGAAATCYPAPHFQETIPNYSKERVVVTGNMITSQGPGTSIQFALTLGEQLFGKEKRDEIAKQMLVD
jgi:4-methyl-5(b-hydroxyethyl)-thiazole monophosphate biosynthesis